MVIRRKMIIQIFFPKHSTYRRTTSCSRTEAGSADWGSKNTGQTRLIMSHKRVLIVVIKQSPCTVACNFTLGDLHIEIYYCRSKSSSLFFFSFIRCMHQHPQYICSEYNRLACMYFCTAPSNKSFMKINYFDRTKHYSYFYREQNQLLDLPHEGVEQQSPGRPVALDQATRSPWENGNQHSLCLSLNKWRWDEWYTW